MPPIASATISKDAYEKLFRLGHHEIKQITSDAHPIAGVRLINQDSHGFLWLASDTGLYRYDGYEFVVFKHRENQPQSLSGSHIRSLWISDDDQFWVGILGDGINIFNPEKGVLMHLKHYSPDGLKLTNSDVLAIHGNDQQTVAIASRGGLDLAWQDNGTIRIQAAQLTGTCSTDFTQSLIHSLTWQDSSTLWIAGTFGLCRVSVDEKREQYQAERIPVLDKKHIRGLSFIGNHLWVGSVEQEVWRVNTSTYEVDQARLNHPALADTKGWVFDFVLASDDEIWAAVFGSGVFVIDPTTLELKQVIQPSDTNSSTITTKNITKLFKDASGIVWIASWGERFFRVDPMANAVRRIVANSNSLLGPRFNNIKSLSEMANGDIALANAEGGLDIFSVETGNFSLLTTLTPLDSQPVMITKTAPDGRLWVGTMGGLYIYDRATNTASLLPLNSENDVALEIAFSKSGDTAFIAGTGFFYRYKLTTQTLEAISQVSNQTEPFAASVHTFFVAPNDDLWIASAAGVYLLKQNATELIAVNDEAGTAPGLEKTNTLSIAQHPDGALLFINQKQRALLKAQDYYTLPLKIERLTMAEDIQLSGDLWVDMHKRVWNGGSVYDAVNQHWLNIGSAVGMSMACYQRSVQYRANDFMLLGCNKGIIAVDLNRWSPWSFKPKAKITALEINGNSNNIDTELTLQPENKSVSVQFSALDFSSPDKVQYRHKLKGFDTQWQKTTERRVTYTNLSPGSYTLMVKASNSIGLWGSPSIMLSIYQSPAWYETNAFYVACILVLALCIYLIIKYRERSLRQKAVLLNQLVEDKTYRIEQLGNIGKQLTASLDLDAVVTMMHQRVVTLLKCDAFLIALTHSESGRLDVIGCFENGERLANFSFELSDKARPAVWCVQHQRELFTSTEDEIRTLLNEDLKPTKFGQPMESVIYIPLTSENQVIGCISIQAVQPHKFKKVDMRTLETIASYFVVALENARTHEALKSTQEKLIESEKIASLTYVVTGVAHEMNTPIGVALTAISGLGSTAQTVSDGLQANKVKKSELEKFTSVALQTESLVLKSLQRCSTLIDNFKRLSADQTSSDKRKVRLKTYLEELMAAFTFILEQKGILLSVEGEDFDAVIDRGVVSQIIGCLVNNVIEHAYETIEPESKDHKTIELRVKKEGAKARVEFYDNGVGISEEKQKQVIIPFFTTKRGSGHTGLGLNIVYNLTTAVLKGEFELLSDTGQGTRVILRFPTE